MKTHIRVAVLLLVCAAIVAPRPVFAQAARLGETFLVTPAAARGSAIAYDWKNHVYLMVSGHGAILGRFVSEDGAPLGTPFQLQQVVSWGQFPQLAYSPDADNGNGGFLVTWHESDAPGAPSVHGRMVSFISGLISPDRKLTINDTYWEIMGPPVAYSTVSHEFLVVWRAYATVDILGMRIDNAGAPLSGMFAVAATPSFESSPSLAYNPTQDEFFLLYTVGTGAVASVGQRIKPVTGAMIGAPTPLGTGSAVYTTSVTYNTVTGQYQAAWQQLPSNAILSRVVNADGTPVGNVNALSTRWGTYDSLSVAANPVSGTTFMVGHDKLSIEDGGVEVNASGLPVDNGFLVTATGAGGGNFYPRIASHATRSEWMAVTVNGFSKTLGQRITTNTRTGPTSNPQMAVEAPGAGTVAAPFDVQGWAVDLGSANSSGADNVDVWALPASGDPIYIGSVAPSSARPDIGQVFGAQFTNSGFKLRVTNLPVGSYQLAVFMRSTVTGTYNAVRVVNITVTQHRNELTRASDFDGDARSEMTVYNASTGVWSILKSGSGYSTATSIGWGGPGYTAVPGDYDGDGRTDLGVYQQSSGNWYVLLSSTNYTTSLFKNAGGPGWDPVAGDYDGDGKTDFAVYNRSSGLWFALKSGSGYTTTVSMGWGGAGYTPAPGDFDGDGKVDLAVYNDSIGTWYVLLSASGYTSSLSKNAGGAGYVPVQADYDGDGRTDFAVYNTTTGLWYGLKSSTGYTTTIAVYWGGPAHDPVRGDYDGDGKADLAAYERATGNWYVLLSGSAYTTVLSKSWGGSGFQAVPRFH